VEKYFTARQTTVDNITQRLLITCGIPKAIDTHPKYVTLTAFARQKS
jgi:hypothetical protein